MHVWSSLRRLFTALALIGLLGSAASCVVTTPHRHRAHHRTVHVQKHHHKHKHHRKHKNKHRPHKYCYRGKHKFRC